MNKPMDPKVCLCFIYNNRFDENIAKLNSIYGARFSNIFHLVPFYDGDRSDVIPVYEHSFYFQGYIPQSIGRITGGPYSHYIFLGDDVLLNPILNESNIIEKLGLDNDTAFIPELWGMLNDMSFNWANTFPSLNAFYLDKYFFHHAVNWKNELPPLNEAWEIFEKYGFAKGKIKNNFSKSNAIFQRWDQAFFYYLKLMFGRKRTLPYPLVAGYSDFVVVPAAYMNEFSRLCEVTRRMRLWVEVAIPSILLLSIPFVKTEKNIDKKGITYWDNKNMNDLQKRCDDSKYDLNILMNSFSENELFIHPVKFSQWKI